MSSRHDVAIKALGEKLAELKNKLAAEKFSGFSTRSALEAQIHSVTDSIDVLLHSEGALLA
jgi:dynactin complex subunit